MFHLHINERFHDRPFETPRQKNTREVMGKWYMLYSQYVKLYLLFEPGELR